MTHPVIKAARAAGAELTSESAQKFFRDVALRHLGLFVYYLFESAPFTVRAGRWLRSRLKPEDEILILLLQGMLFDHIPWMKSQAPSDLDFDRFKTSLNCAGLLSTAPEEEQPIATLAAAPVKTNQQKLEDQITKAIRGIYDQTIQDYQENLPACDQIINPSIDTEHLELVHSEDTNRAIGEALTVKATVARTRKTGAASGNRAKSVDKQDSKSRVPRKKPSVSG
jgi:hypothetical protein